MGKNWWETLYTYIWVFNTGRGLSIFIRLPTNYGIIYDLGCTDIFSPCEFIKKNILPHLAYYQPNNDSNQKSKIAQCVLSHPHLDHIQEMSKILEDDSLYPILLTCQNDHEKEDNKINFSRIEREDNKNIIEQYKKGYEGRNPPLQTIKQRDEVIPNLEYGIYYLESNRVEEIHPSDNQLYVNGLSILLFLRHGNQSILIPGDMTPESFEEMLNDGDSVQKRYTFFYNNSDNKPDTFFRENSNQPSLCNLLNEMGLSVLIAPHHGLESCFSSHLFDIIKDNKPQINVISMSKKHSDNGGNVSANYQNENYAKGINVDIEGVIENHLSISTKQGHHILIVFKGTDALPHIYLRKDPNELLNIQI